MKRNPLKELMDSEKKSLIFANTVVFIVMLISLFYLNGCGDYYVNVDKEAVKLDVPLEQIDKNTSVLFE